MDNWISVFETDQIYLAESIKSILDESDIDSVLLNQKDSSYPMLGVIQIMVHQEEKEKAEEIIKSIEREQF